MTDVTTGMPSNEFVDALARARVMAIIRGADTDAAVAASLALFEEGVRFVEISLTTPKACHAIARVREQLPEGAQIERALRGSRLRRLHKEEIAELLVPLRAEHQDVDELHLLQRQEMLAHLVPGDRRTLH